MATKTYAEKLKDPRWQRKRLEIMQRDGFKCTKCGDTKNTLHVHHKRYTNESPWKHLDSDLTTLCAECHKNEHYEIKMIEDGILKVSDFVKKHPEVTKLFTCIENHEGIWTLTLHDKAKFYYPFIRLSTYEEKVLYAIDDLVNFLDKEGSFDKYIHIESYSSGQCRGNLIGEQKPRLGDMGLVWSPVNFYDVIKSGKYLCRPAL